MNEKKYMSERELMELIESAENEPLSKAPGYLKEQILYKASKQDSFSQIGRASCRERVSAGV